MGCMDEVCAIQLYAPPFLSLMFVVSSHGLLTSKRRYRGDDDGERQYSRCGMAETTCCEYFDLDHTYR